MGGFAAILRRDIPGDVPAFRRTIARMLEASPHRGTERDIAVSGRVAVGISTGDGDIDAWLCARDGFVAALVGRLDNLTELSKRFQERDSQTGATPADVVLAVFGSRREDAPTEFRGTYAAFVSDGAQVWTWRDHLSFGQALYRLDDWGFYVATEAKQVVAGAGIAKEPDLPTVEGWFYGQIQQGPLSETDAAIRGVRRAGRAVITRSDGRRLWQRRYWHPDRIFESATDDDAGLAERFDGLMAQAVERVLTGNDVVSLSGGVDSPAVAAYAAAPHLEMSGRSLAALSLVFPDFPDVDESRYAEIVARRYDLDAHSVTPAAQPLDDISDWVRLCDSPCPVNPPAEAAEYYRAVRSLGRTNIIGGELAEFCTAERAALLSHLVAQRKVRTMPAVIRSQRDIGISWLGIARQLLSPVVPRAALAIRERWRPLGNLPRWVDERRVRAGNARNLRGPLERYRWEQVGFFTGPPIGAEADATVQAVCGVLNRRPWVDVDVAEFFISLPAEVKFPDFRFKTLVRRLLRGRVPDEVLDRTDKTYFNSRILGTIDWDAMAGWLIRPEYRMPGVDYTLLGELIESRSFSIGDAKWAADLAKTHAFVAMWT